MITRRAFIRDGVAAFTVSFAAPAFLSDIARRAGRAEPKSRRRLPQWRQRCAEHGDSLPGSVLLQPPPDACDSGRPGPADRQRRQRSDARPASTAGRSARHLQRGPPRRGAAYRLSEFQPLALSGDRHQGHRRPQFANGARLARSVPRHAAGACRCADGMERDA